MAGLGTLVLAACGGGEGDPEVTPTAPTTPDGTDEPVDGDQEIVDAIRAAGFGDLTPDYLPLIASFEVLAGPGHVLNFGLLDNTQTPLPDADLEVRIVRSGDLEVVGTASNPPYYGEGLGIRGIYSIEVDLDATVPLHYLVIATDGHVGVRAMQVVEPASSQVITPGTSFPALVTPTVDDPQDLEELCTSEPDCSMHGTSLDTVIGQGKPVVLIVATPAFCTTAICGPVVDVVELVKQEVGDDAEFIHAEVFTDAGNTPTQTVNELGLPSEPWTFVIDGDGVLATRIDGPIAPQLVRNALDAL